MATATKKATAKTETGFQPAQQERKSSRLNLTQMILLNLLVAANSNEEHEEDKQIFDMLNIDVNLVKKLALAGTKLTTPDAAGITLIDADAKPTQKGFKFVMQSLSFGVNLERLFKGLNFNAMLPAAQAMVTELKNKLTNEKGEIGVIFYRNREGNTGFGQAWNDVINQLCDLVEAPPEQK